MKTLKTLITTAVLVVVAPLAITAQAQAVDHGNMSGMKMDGMSTMKMDQPAATEMTDGEVRKIDKDNQKITIKHGDIRNLDMPGMTMVFKVKDLAMLDKVKAGDKVRFKAEKADGAIVVTVLEART
ncbi:copper-binding protein [Methylibium sp.]|uniref:copper-binding protein n=1 Tax=Methylibium sp. TaxID=2067992 RepID=UPI003BAB1C09